MTMKNYDKKRPSTKVLTGVLEWLRNNDMHVYTGCSDLETGQRGYGCMDIETADQVISVAKRNKNNTWIEPELLL